MGIFLKANLSVS